MDASTLAAAIDPLLHSEVTGVRRVYYEIAGELDRSEGALEITTASGCVVLDADEDDDGLEAVTGPWQDPAGADPDFAATAGRWVPVDAADEAWARGLVGTSLTAYELGGDAFGTLSAQLRCGDITVRAEVADGELWVSRVEPAAGVTPPRARA